jgi:hypothetical protein
MLFKGINERFSIILLILIYIITNNYFNQSDILSFKIIQNSNARYQCKFISEINSVKLEK